MFFLFIARKISHSSSDRLAESLMLSWFAVNSRRGMVCRRVIIRETSRPNLDRQPSEREVPGTPWSSVGHAGMFFQDTETEPELLEPALFARNRSRAGAAGTFCSEPEPELSITISYTVGCRRCGSAVSRVTTWAKRAAVKCDATTWRSTAVPATETSRAPSCTAKLSQRV